MALGAFCFGTACAGSVRRAGEKPNGICMYHCRWRRPGADGHTEPNVRLFILCFTAGVVCLQQQAVLPDGRVLALIATLSIGLLVLGCRWRPAFLIAASLLGLFWAGAAAQLRLDESLAEAQEGRDLRVVGVVSGLPQRFDNGSRFDFLVESAEAPLPEHVSLAWYRGWGREAGDDAVDGQGALAPLPVHAGERWALVVRLKRPHGNANPEGFDFEGWLLETGTRATGTVRPGAENRRVEAFVATPGTVIARLRESVRENFFAAMPDAPYLGILVALTVGDQQAIGEAQWLVFSRTGVTHLVSISGLHLTMFASLAYALVSWLWRRSPALMQRLPAQKAAALAGFCAAWFYCLLSGFAVPAQRTLYMLAVVALALYTQRATSPSRVLALALLVVLLLDPWAVLAAGFWLSFGCVALLFYVAAGRLGGEHWLGAWVRAQWALCLGMIPALLLLFQQFSLVSPVANAVAIPVVSFLVTPLALAAAASPLLMPVLPLAHAIMQGLMLFLLWLAELPIAVWQQAAPPTWAWLLALPGASWWLAPRGMPARWLGAVLFLPLLTLEPPRPAPGEALVTTLDVGQGLAMHIQTATHDLLYDTGPAYSLEANSGNRVILPYLRARGVRRLDGLIVTHQDKDHSGGAESLLQSLPAGWLMSSLAFEHDFSALPLAALPCADGQGWQWDGVHFLLLHPPAAQYDAPTKRSNDMSCVLKISTAYGRVLLTSDIEARSEQALLSQHRSELKSEVLIAPHHGSRTSSTPAFIAAVGASQVIFPVGYRNRFGHPRADVVARYQATGATLHRTDAEGALSLRLAPSQPPIAAERALRRRYWHGR